MADARSGSVAWLVVGLSSLLVYGPLLLGLIRDWASDDNYSHGFAVLPLAAYFAWERRHSGHDGPSESRLGGLGLVGIGLAMFLVGQLGAERFISRVSLVVVLSGSTVYCWGWRTLRRLVFPFAFLLLMIPMPALVFNQVAFPLQLAASDLGAKVLAAVGVPVLREGNLVFLARTTLEVAEACSGIRSLISLFTVGVVYGYFSDDRVAVRWAIALVTIPIAIVANGVRVAGAGLLSHRYGDAAARGFVHAFSGWLMFAFAFGLLFAAALLISRVAGARGERVRS